MTHRTGTNSLRGRRGWGWRALARCGMVGAFLVAVALPLPRSLAQTSGNVEIRDATVGTDRATRYGVTETGPCMGFIPDAPHYVLNLSEPSRVRIRVRASADTTLVVRAERARSGARHEVWCNDDVDGHNPGLSHILDAGVYLIWVGSWDSGSAVHFTMNVDVDPVALR